MLLKRSSEKEGLTCFIPDSDSNRNRPDYAYWRRLLSSAQKAEIKDTSDKWPNSVRSICSPQGRSYKKWFLSMGMESVFAGSIEIGRWLGFSALKVIGLSLVNISSMVLITVTTSLTILRRVSLKIFSIATVVMNWRSR